MVHFPYKDVLKEKIPIRALIVVMLFTASWTSLMLRLNLSINIIAMVEPTKSTSGQVLKPECQIDQNYTGTNTSISEPVEDFGDRYAWPTTTQGLVLGSYFWGYVITSLPGGLIADYFGGTKLIGFTTGLSALLTALIPYAASVHYGFLLALRFLLGLLGGVVYPGLQNLVAKWAPPDEKGKFVSALLGGTFGTVVTWAFCGYLIETFGWQSGFYVPAAISLLWSLLWFVVVSDAPATHNFITSAEVDYIKKCQGGNISKKKSLPPFGKLITSMPFYAVMVLHFGSTWGLFFLMTSAPAFLKNVVGFSLKNSGFLAGLPYLSRMVMGIIFGAAGDYLRKKKWMSVTTMRKVFCVFSHLIPGVFLFGLANIGCEPMLLVAIITFSLGFNGAATMTNLQNVQDLAPNYAGTIYGIINCVGSFSGFISPSLVGYFIKDNNGIAEWHKVFWVGGFVYIIPALWFFAFGSGEVQPWNEIAADEETPKQKSITDVPNYDKNSKTLQETKY